MSIQELEQFCDNWLAAWTGNAPELLLPFYTEDALYRDPSTKSSIQGHIAMLSYFKKLLKNNPDWVWTREELMPTEKGFTLKWKAEIPIGNKIIHEFGLDIVELSDGKISRNEVYFDTLALMNATIAMM
jgi:hypothetical protein